MYAQIHLFKCEITTITVGNCDQEKPILDGIEFWVSKIIHKDICIKAHRL